MFTNGFIKNDQLCLCRLKFSKQINVMKVRNQLHNLLHRLAYDATFQYRRIVATSTNSYMSQQSVICRHRERAEYPSVVLKSKQI